MRFDVAIDRYIREQWADGRFNSDSTERNYRLTLNAHADDVGNRDPRYTNRDDVKTTLRRWGHPNSRRKNRSILKSFYAWAVQEGMRKDNPVEQTRPTKQRAPDTRRLTRDEVVRLLDATETERERRALLPRRLRGPAQRGATRATGKALRTPWPHRGERRDRQGRKGAHCPGRPRA